LTRIVGVPNLIQLGEYKGSGEKRDESVCIVEITSQGCFVLSTYGTATLLPKGPFQSKGNQRRRESHCDVYVWGFMRGNPANLSEVCFLPFGRTVGWGRATPPHGGVKRGDETTLAERWFEKRVQRKG